MKSAPCFEIDCVINFWDLARYAEKDPEELFYSLWPDAYYEEDTAERTFVIVDCFEKITYKGEDEVREAWNDVKFYIEDCGYRFYDKVMFVF